MAPSIARRPCLRPSWLPGWWRLITNSGPHAVAHVTSHPCDDMPADALQARRSPVPWLPSRAKSTTMSHRPAPRSPTHPNVPHAVLTHLGLHLCAQAPSLCPRQCHRILTHTPVLFDADEHAETHSPHLCPCLCKCPYSHSTRPRTSFTCPDTFWPPFDALPPTPTRFAAPLCMHDPCSCVPSSKWPPSACHGPADMNTR